MPRTLALFIFACLLITGCSDSTEAPSPRSGFGFVYDEARHELLLFGGSDSTNTRLGDTWTWSDGVWTQHTVTGPSARSDLQITFHAATGEAVLFGGLTADGLSAETWTWNGDAWTLADTTGPSRRQLGTMAHDAASGQSVLFGGSGPGRESLADTWIWDGSTWTEAAALTLPTARGAHQMAFDHETERIVMVGGWDGTSASDMWAWDGLDWSLVDTVTTPARLHGSMIFDEAQGGLVLFGGFGESGRENTAWMRSGNEWILLSPAGALPEIRAEHDGVYHPDLGAVFFGGITGDGMALADRTKSNELWMLKDGQWTLK